MDNFKNLKEDKDLFPYEYGAEDYRDMRGPIKALLRREELSPNFDLLKEHIEECGIHYTNILGDSRLQMNYCLSQYMNYKIRFGRPSLDILTNAKVRELLEPLAKILCSEKIDKYYE